jgi:hypothetical protein
MKRLVMFLLIVNISLWIWGISKPQDKLNKLDVQEITIKQKDGSKLVLNSSGIAFLDKQNKKRMTLSGGDEPCIGLYDEKEVSLVNLAVLSESSGIFLKNNKNVVVGSWTFLEDGSCGFGLANKEGSASTILRGGESCGLSLYNEQNLPIGTFGVMEKVPHLLISGQEGEESILLHGGVPTSMMLMNEQGQLMVLISKKGVFKGKEAPDKVPTKPKFFTFEKDQEKLFPSHKKTQ